MHQDYSQCAKCSGNICYSSAGAGDDLSSTDQLPEFCPMRRTPKIIESAKQHYEKANIQELARVASILEAECYELTAEGIQTKIPRIEEIMQFAKKCHFQRLGVAFCIGLWEEASQLVSIFENKGFEVVSVNCKAGRMPKASIGLKDDEKIGGTGLGEPMCNPILQAAIMNAEEVDFAVMLGLCVGHDSLFMKYCEVPATVLAVKDRVTGHNPPAALYSAKSSYNSRLQVPVRKDADKGEWKKVDITVED